MCRTNVIISIESRKGNNPVSFRDRVCQLGTLAALWVMVAMAMEDVVVYSVKRTVKIIPLVDAR